MLENIVWLDGYLKGIAAAIQRNRKISFNAISLELDPNDPVNSYEKYINDDRDYDAAEGVPLKFNDIRILKNWQQAIEGQIIDLLADSVDSAKRISAEIVDILGAELAEEDAMEFCECSANFADLSGTYFFFRLNEMHLVIGFMQES